MNNYFRIIKYLNEYGGTHHLKDDSKTSPGELYSWFDEQLNNYTKELNLSSYGKLQWQNSGAISDYWWGKLYGDTDRQAFPISLFIENTAIGNEKEYGIRITVELDERVAKQSLSGEDLYNMYNEWSTTAFVNDDIYYYVGDSRTAFLYNGKNVNEANRVKDNNKGVRIQPSLLISVQEEHDDDEIKQSIEKAIETFLPYYNELVSRVERKENAFLKRGATDMTVIQSKNLILYGPPGTGKTYNTAIYAVSICDSKSVDSLIDYDKVIERYNELREEKRIIFTTFHQSYGYEEFIEGIKPNIGKENSSLDYSIEPGVFKQFCKNAHDARIHGDNKPFVFVIDEINRGNISKIFGELITLIEDKKREGEKEAASAILPYSGEPFSVPNNVYIIGTMNTADRSIALMDTALRRRFQFEEKMPDTSLLSGITVEGLNVASMLDTINERISFLYDREHTIGHAYFMELREDPSLTKLATIFSKNIIPLLQEYFYEDYQKIQFVLGDNGKTDEAHKFIKDVKVNANAIFKGSVEDITDLPEQKYEINIDALYNIQSYKEIMK